MEFLPKAITSIAIVILLLSDVIKSEIVLAPVDISITEGTPAGSDVLDLTQYNLPDGNIAQRVIGGEHHTDVYENAFMIVNNNVIRTTVNISRDQLAHDLQDQHSPVIFVVDLTVLQFTPFFEVTMMTVNLRVLDLDNNIPVFLGYTDRPFHVTYREGRVSTDIKLIPPATDIDEGNNTVQRYVMSNDFDGLFGLDLRRHDNDEFIEQVRLTQRGELDREHRSNYTLDIIAYEGTDTPNSATLKVIITIEDVCDESPTFPVTRYFTSILENSPRFSVIPSNISVMDPDIVDIGRITYSITQVCSLAYENSMQCIVQPDHPFTLDTESGELTLDETVDREVAVQYELSISAEDSCTNVGTAIVVVTIGNINDNPPIISHRFQIPSNGVPESFGVPGEIFYLRIADADDVGVTPTPTYNLELHDNTTGDMLETSTFGLRLETLDVNIVLTASLDREVRDYYSLVIHVTDTGTPNMSSLFHLPVYVTDVNDNSPIFDPVLSIYSFAENQDHNIVLLELTARDLDEVENGNGDVSYFLPPNNGTFSHQHLFVVDSIGRLFANGTLDREEQVSLSVLVEARDNPRQGTARSDFVVINMILTDLNDNDPVITSPPETLSLSESLSVGAVVFKISATDLDSEMNSNLTYSLMQPDQAPFQVDSISGNVTLGSLLDFEAVTEYNLTVIASDSERMGTRAVMVSVLDVNDERCEFNAFDIYTTAVQEELPLNLNVIKINASDEDTPADMLIFSLVGGNVLGNFNINPLTGQIATTVSLDKEITSNYTLTVSCSDGSDSPTTIDVFVQVLDINDNLPQFVGLPYNFTVSENLPSGTTVGMVQATDADSPEHGMFHFRILFAIPNSTVSWFRISPTSGVITTTQALDREDIRLIGVENSQIGLNVEAYDITTQGSSAAQFNTTFVFVQIADDNDKSPEFATSNITIRVRENFAINNNFPVRIHATDDDIHPHNVILYMISTRSPPETSRFTILEDTGYLRLVSTLDYETQNRYEFEVLAIDADMRNRQAVQNVIIIVENVAEVDIKFDDFVPHVNLMENAPLNTTLSEFTVTDKSNTPLLLNLATLAYTITENGIPPTDIGIRNMSADGLLIVYVLGNIDRESLVNGLERVFNVTAWDTDTSERSHGSTSAIMRVTILDQNDNPPFFTSPSYAFSVVENNDISLSIGTVAAMDLDFGSNGTAGITYSISDTVPFQINNIGEVRTTERLDREENPVYNFNIIASDGGPVPTMMTSTVPVSITIDDVNDNAPVFDAGQVRVFNVTENHTINTEIGNLIVNDADAGFFGEVSVSLGGSAITKFRVDSNGSIVLVQSLDRELEEEYSFMVVAMDGGGRRSTADVQILVGDSNDNPPIFESGMNTYFIQEDQMENVEIAHFTANDNDIGDNGRVKYAIVSYNLSSTFCINEYNGSLSVCSQDSSDSCSDRPVIDFERRNVYELTIVAYDNSPPTHLVYKTITINIVDDNEHAPTFDSSSILVYVNETRDIGVEVARVKAIDKDKDDHINYEVLDGNQQSLVFRYNQDIGAIVNNGILDVRQRLIYNLTLVARDNGNRSGTTTVIVVVHNINDNTPAFENVDPLNQPIIISENTPVSTVVWTVKATDEDNNTHDAVSYFFDDQSGDSTHHFSVDSLTGEISVNSTLDYELRNRYELVVLAVDTGSPPRTSTPLVIVISLKNENDEYPIFSSSNYQFSVYEKEPAGTVVDQVSAHDRDLGTFGDVKYFISGGGTNDYFAINPSSGEITTRVIIDRDAIEEAPGGSDVLYFQFSVLAIDGASGSAAKTNVTNVRVRILDKNDNAPQFSSFQYLIRVSPDQVSPITTPISVTDRDEGSNSLYHFDLLPNGDFLNFPLQLSPTAQIVFEGPLPASQPSYTYTIRVIDDNNSTLSNTAKLELIIETDNDNSPRFDRVIPNYQIDIRELEEINRVIFEVSNVVTDPDSGLNGQLSYQFAENSDPHFAINESTGAISLQQMLDFETSRGHNLTVVVLDHTQRRASGIVMVTVLPDNEYTPEFYDIPSQLILSYLPQVGLSIFNVTARDMDDGIDGVINFSISPQDLHFEIDTETGVIRNKGVLDVDMTLNVTICAYDRGNPLRATNTTISVSVRNAGETSTPIFLGNNPRTIGEPEDISENSFINTNTPFSTSPSAQSYHVVSQKRLGESAQIDKFFVSETGGILRVQGTLDFETTTMFTIIIESRRETVGMSGSVIERMSDFLTVLFMVADVNDNEPVFSPIDDQEFVESTPVGMQLFSVQASDLDSGLEGAVSYDIIQGDNEGTFRINSSTGEVFLHQPLDREAVGAYDLEIRAQDLSNEPLTSSLTVHIDVIDENDFVTTYGGRNFSIDVYEYPSTNVGERIVKLSALDEDEGPSLTYSMELLEVRHSTNSLPVSNYRGSFSLDPLNGLISIGSQILDREIVDYFLFRVRATDRVHNVDTYLTIRVLDVNDRPPVVMLVPSRRIPVWEDQPEGLFVTNQVLAADGDVGINSWVKYSLGDGWPGNYFRIDPLSGVIRTNDVIDAASDVIIAETDNLAFTGTVIIEDQGINPHRVSTLVYVKIVDVNNHPPELGSDFILLNVSMGAMRGTPIHQFTSTDRDSDVNVMPVMYTIPDYFTDVHNNFRIDESTGAITLQKIQEDIRSYNFLLHASNPSHNPECAEFMQASTINVTILVRPLNSHCPEFTQPPYRTEIAEETATSNVLIEVTATDSDGDGVTYSIINVTDHPFSIDRMTGALTLQGTLDREMNETLNIFVLATDDGFPPRSCSTEVIVIVLDINDHSPLFNQSRYTGMIEENTPADEYVLTVFATDVDLGQAGTVVYQLVHDNFRINETTGEIFTRQPLDYETIQNYTISVVAHNIVSNIPMLPSTATVTIAVVDVNEGKPIITPQAPGASIIVDQNRVNGDVIYTVVATDPDTRVQLTYFFSAPFCYLSINNRTGDITLQISSSNKSCPILLVPANEPQYYTLETNVSVSDGTDVSSTPLKFNFHVSFVESPVPKNFLSIEIIAGGITGVLLVILVVMCMCVFVCICRYKKNHSKIRINDTAPGELELQKRFGSGRSGNSMQTAPVYKQTSLHPDQYITMAIAHSNGSGASSARQSYVCGDIETDQHEKNSYPSPSNMSRKSQLSRPYRSTSDLGSSTMATDISYSQETAPYPKSQIDRIYAKNADLFNQSDSNESIHMFGSEGGGESDGGDDMLFRKFNDLDDDDDSTTMPEDDEDDRSYQRRSMPSSRENINVHVPPVDILEDPYPYDHQPAMNWAPRVSNMADTIDQIAIHNYKGEEPMRHGGQHYSEEFGKSQTGSSVYGGPAMSQESARPLLRHTPHSHSHHHQSRLPPQHMMEPPPNYYGYEDGDMQEMLHEQLVTRTPVYGSSSGTARSQMYGSSTGIPNYSNRDIPRGHQMDRRGGEASQEVPGMGAYDYHGDYMHHSVHHDNSSPSSSTPTDGTLTTRALTNEYESDMMYSSDASINTNTEMDHHTPSQHMRGYAQPNHSQRGHPYH